MHRNILPYLNQVNLQCNGKNNTTHQVTVNLQTMMQGWRTVRRITDLNSVRIKGIAGRCYQDLNNLNNLNNLNIENKTQTFLV